jgi:predicted Zn-dependent protease
MRKYIVLVIVLAAVGVGAAFMLLPGKSGAPAVPMQAQAPVPAAAPDMDFEAEYNAGARTFIVVSGLADKRVAEGNRPAAIQLLEEYVTANPNDVNGRKKLAEQYQLAGDNAKYNEQLVAIANAEPTEANLKMLADVYNAGQMYDKQIEILRKLVEVTNKQKPEYMADLATILVVQGQKEEAVALVKEIRSLHPSYRSYALTRIEASALVADGKGDDAYQLAERWMTGDVAAPQANAVAPNTKELADLANILHYGGFPEHAIRLIEPRVALIASDAELAVAYVNANITAGHSDRAFQVLTEIYNTGTMDAALYGPYIDLALKRDDLSTVGTVVANLRPEIFTEVQAIDLIELQSVQNNPEIASRIVNAFDVTEYLANKPVLAAVVAMGQKSADQDQKIATALTADLSSNMRVRLAKACYRAKKDACIDEVVKGFPPVANMTRPQVDEYADLHIVIERAPVIVDTVGAEVTAGRKELEPAYIRLAAASGKSDVVEQWLIANGNSSDIPQLQRLYYIAADHNQPATAMQFAVKLFERDPSPMNREILVASYIRAGEYAKALPLVRDNLGKTAGASEQYVTVLSKLARTDADARKELTDYAMSVLSTSDDNAAQLTAAYTLINNGQRSAAMPYIKSNADAKGGEWAVMWRQLNPVKSVASGPAKKLTPEQMIAIAGNPKTSEQTKRQMAFNLINEGRKAEAAAIFQSLAATRGPEDQNVKDLLYLWGPKLNAEQVAWLNQRAKASTNTYEQAKWGDYINTYGDDNAIVQYVSSTPEALYNRDLRKKYFRSLASYGSRDVYDTNMRGWVAGTTDVEALRDYAETAQAFGYDNAALSAYKRIEQVAPGDEQTLARLGALNYSKAKYTASQDYLKRYERARATKPQPETNPQEAYFYQAQLFRRQGNTAAAQAEFQKVVAASQGATAVDAQSRLYTSLFHLGDHEQAKQGFRALLAQNPDNKGLLADYMSVLIEYKYLDEATAIANQYDKNSPYYQKQSYTVQSPNVSRVERLSNGREMKISFSQPIDGKSPLKGKDYAWVEKTEAAHDSVVISAKPGFEVRFVPTAVDSMQVVPVPVPNYAPQEQMAREQELRLQLLYAQIEQQNGQSEAASQRLAILQQHYPNNPQLLTYAAGIENAAGNREEALNLLAQAQSIAPDNEDISAIMTNTQNAGVYSAGIRNYLKADYEYRSFGDNNEHIGTLSGAIRASNNVELGFNLKHDDMDLDRVRDARTGNIGNWQTDRQQAELYAAYLLDGGARAQASLFANNDTAGGGLYYDFDNAIGRTGVFAEYHRPYWDFVGSRLRGHDA